MNKIDNHSASNSNQSNLPLIISPLKINDSKLPFLNYINSFRAIAIIVIVMGHIISYLNWSNKYSLMLANIVLSNGTVFFVFIAGYLFQYLLKRYEYKSYLLKKIKFVIIPYCLTSIPAIAGYFLGIFSFPENFEKLVSHLSPLEVVFICLITGKHLGPFWFIPMISVFYLLAPFLIKLTQSKYSVPIIISLSILAPLLFSRTLPTSYLHFLPVYLLGMLVCRHEPSVFNFLDKFFIFLYLFVFALWAVQFLLIHDLNIGDRFFNTPFFGINTISKEILSPLIIYSLSKIPNRNPGKTSFLSQCSSLLAELSFGIYFVHEYVLRIYFVAIKQWFPNIVWLIDGGIVTIFIGSSVVTIFCIVFLQLSKKILKKKSRYCLGC